METPLSGSYESQPSSKTTTAYSTASMHPAPNSFLQQQDSNGCSQEETEERLRTERAGRSVGGLLGWCASTSGRASCARSGTTGASCGRRGLRGVAIVVGAASSAS